MTTVDNAFCGNLRSNFICEFCDYTTSRKWDFKRHVESKKHRSVTQTTQNNAKCGKLRFNYICSNCDKDFSDRAGLWRHKKKCLVNNNVVQLIPTDIQGQTDLVNYLLKENAEFKQLMMEQNKQMIVLAQNAGNNNTSNNNSCLLYTSPSPRDRQKSRMPSSA